jgi:hypothetical protein
MQTTVGQIRHSIRPLTNELGFHLEIVRYGEYREQVELILVSGCLSITFDGFSNENPRVRCTFTVHPHGKTFHGMYLFPALGLEIPYPPPLDLLTVPPPSDFFADLNKLCRKIRLNFDAISSAFEKNIIKNTIRLYSAEFRKWDKERVIFPPTPSLTCTPETDKEKTRIDDRCIDRILAVSKILGRDCQRLTISCDFMKNRIEVSFYSNISLSYAKYLIHKENNEIGLYFVLDPRDFVKNTEAIKNPPVVFSYRNVFRFLGIDFSYHPKGTYEDIREVFQVLHDNSEKIFPAFSRERLVGTYNALKDTPGNNEEEIRSVLKKLVELVD